MSGMNAATQRLQTSAGRIASGSGEGVQDAVDLMTSRVGFEANIQVAKVAAQMLDRLLDIKI
jgi:flagellar basal body rod protein FlgC